MRRALIAAALFASSAFAHAQDPLDRVSEALTVSFWHDTVRTRLSGTADVELYHFDRPAPGLLDTSSDTLFNPRLTLFLDGQAGAHVYFFSQARLDRGFDPSDHSLEARMEEYAVRVSLWSDGRLNLQAGKFATVLGTWVERHLSWDNPFITAPLPYEHLTAIRDAEAPNSATAFVTLDPAERYEYNPVLWGPVYATGASASGRIEKFEFVAEVKNSGPSSRPDSWILADVGFDQATFGGRLGYHPDLRWSFGLSGSIGPYFRPEAAPLLPKGKSLGDYRQMLLGQDLGFAWHQLQVWAELFQSRFEVPHVGNAETLAYYIEGKYKLTPRLFAGLRWNQQFFARIGSERNGSLRWSEDTTRVDASLVFRWTAHAQAKLQYSSAFAHQSEDLTDLIAAQLTLRF
ncbi:MAG: hypothetical protein U1G07_13360 [Verrucomicrobiota bacterium]